MAKSLTESPALRVALRVVAAVIGGYVMSAAWVALASLALPAAGVMARSEAVVLAGMLGFLIYLVLLIWGFAERRLWRVWAVLGFGTLVALLLAAVLRP